MPTFQKSFPGSPVSSIFSQTEKSYCGNSPVFLSLSTCPRPAQGKPSKKSGIGLISRKLSFFLVTSACFVLFCFVLFCFSGKFVFLENMFQFPDIDILGIFGW